MSKSHKKRKTLRLKKMLKASLLVTSLLGVGSKVMASDPQVMAIAARKHPDLNLTYQEIKAAGNIDAAAAIKRQQMIAAATAAAVPEHVIEAAKAEAKAEAEAVAAAGLEQHKVELQRLSHVNLQHQIAALKLAKQLQGNQFSADDQRRLDELEELIRHPEELMSPEKKAFLFRKPLDLDEAQMAHHTRITKQLHQMIGNGSSSVGTASDADSSDDSQGAGLASASAGPASAGVSSAAQRSGKQLAAAAVPMNQPVENRLQGVLKRTGRADWRTTTDATQENGAGASAAGSAFSSSASVGTSPRAKGLGGPPPPPPPSGMGSPSRRGGDSAGAADAKSGLFAAIGAGGFKLKSSRAQPVVLEQVEADELDRLNQLFETDVRPFMMSPFELIRNLGVDRNLEDLTGAEESTPLSLDDLRILVPQLFPQARGKSDEYLQGFSEARELNTIGDIKDARLKSFYCGAEGLSLDEKLAQVEENFSRVKARAIALVERSGDLQNVFKQFKNTVSERWKQAGNRSVQFADDFLRLERAIDHAVGSANDYPEQLDIFKKLPFDQRLTKKEQLARTQFETRLKQRDMDASQRQLAPYLDNSRRILEKLWEQYDRNPEFRNCIERRIEDGSEDMQRPLKFLYQLRDPDLNANLDWVKGLRPSMAGAGAFYNTYALKALHPLESAALVGGILSRDVGEVMPLNGEDENLTILGAIVSGLRDRYGNVMGLLQTSTPMYHFNENDPEALRTVLAEPIKFAELMSVDNIRRAAACKLDLGLFANVQDFNVACKAVEVAKKPTRVWQKPLADPEDNGAGPA